jgi:uncharacterized protein YndB with AHSA1/START domain
MNIMIETLVKAPLTKVWQAWTTPADIMQWNFASADWCCPRAELDLQVGGRFNYRMEARDGSFGFDFQGEFSHIIPYQCIQYTLADERQVTVQFSESEQGVHLCETFAAEDEHSAQQQQQGWLSILQNFARHVERSA